MKQFTTVTFLIVSLFLASCKSEPQKKEAEKTRTASTINNVVNRVEVIDFYGTHRCVTCKDIEANAKYTIDTYFADEQKKGTVIFKTINVDDDINYKMAEAYEAAGTALFLNVVKGENEMHIDLTDFAFEKGTEQESFSQALKVKIDEQLKNL